MPLSIVDDPRLLEVSTPMLLGDGSKVVKRIDSSLERAALRADGVVEEAKPFVDIVEAERNEAVDVVIFTYKADCTSADSEFENAIQENEARLKSELERAAELYRLACEAAKENKASADTAAAATRDAQLRTASATRDNNLAEIDEVTGEALKGMLSRLAISFTVTQQYAQMLGPVRETITAKMNAVAEASSLPTQIYVKQRIVDTLKGQVIEYAAARAEATGSQKSALTKQFNTVQTILEEEIAELERLQSLAVAEGDDDNVQKKAAESLSQLISKCASIAVFNPDEEDRLSRAVAVAISKGEIDPKNLMAALVAAVHDKDKTGEQED